MEILEFGKIDSDIVLIQPMDKNSLKLAKKEFELIKESFGENFLLTVFAVDDWNRELSPWEAPAAFGREDFLGEGRATLEEIVKYCNKTDRICCIGGYSLAGLFSLWAAHVCDTFSAVAAASPSVWFPGFDTFMKENQLQCENVYLSLGNSEERTKNKLLSSVGDRIRWAKDCFTEQRKNCILEWNEGNHFKDVDIRTAKGFSWVLTQLGY